jgi:hypothetical protein
MRLFLKRLRTACASFLASGNDLEEYELPKAPRKRSQFFDDEEDKA